MMDLMAEELTLIELFREKAADKRREKSQREQDERFRDEQKLQHDLEMRKEKEEKELEEILLATTAQIAAFNDKLDDYDTATVRALMNNQHALDAILQRREDLEARAYRLPDGRMAFKTEDGKHVFDRHGAELSREAIHPEAIPGSAPTWEAMREVDGAEATLLRERDDIHRFQHRLDEVRETAGKGNVTADTLAKMDADLKLAMPDAVKQRLHGAKPEEQIAPEGGNSPSNPTARPPMYSMSAPAP